MIEHKTILLKQLHKQDNKAVINSADSCPN